MTKVEALQQEIEKLDSEEFAQLLEWAIERDSEDWDRQIEEDAAAGKLDKLVKEAREADARGETTDF
jgi:hypothetical protein